MALLSFMVKLICPWNHLSGFHLKGKTHWNGKAKGNCLMVHFLTLSVRHLRQFHPLESWEDTTLLIGPNRPIRPALGYASLLTGGNEQAATPITLEMSGMSSVQNESIWPVNWPNGLYCVRHLSFHSTGHPESLHTTLTCTRRALGAESGQGLCQECLSKQTPFTPDLYRCADHDARDLNAS